MHSLWGGGKFGGGKRAAGKNLPGASISEHARGVGGLREGRATERSGGGNVIRPYVEVAGRNVAFIDSNAGASGGVPAGNVQYRGCRTCGTAESQGFIGR